MDSDTSIPVYTASITPAGLSCAAEFADGVFPVWMDPEKYSVLAPHLEKGFTKAGNGKSLQQFDIAPNVAVALGDDLDACRLPIKQHMALYIGGMGAKGKNFYTNYTASMGFAEAAERIQDLFLAGKQKEAVAAVPDELVDAVAMVGPESRIRERAEAWKAAAQHNQVGTLLLSIQQPELIPLLADIFIDHK